MPFRIPSLFLIFSFFCVPLYGQQEFFPFLAEITSKNVHVRSGQSFNFESLCKMKQGEEVIVLEKVYSWYKVQLPSTARSFIHKKYVTLSESDQGIVFGNHVNVRAGAGINYSILGQLNTGEKVVVLEKIKDWYKVVPIDGTYGWIKDDFIAFKSNDISTYHHSQVINETKQAPEQAQESKVVIAPIEDTVFQEKPSVEKKEAVIAVAGLLKSQKDSLGKPIYLLKVNGQTTYYLKGDRQIFDEFMNYKVSIAGVMDVEAQAQTTHPTVKISKIELVL